MIEYIYFPINCTVNYVKCDELKPRYLNMFDKFGLLRAGVYIVRSIGAKPI